MHNTLIRREVEQEQGFVVKSAGDGYMIAFSSAGRGLRASHRDPAGLRRPTTPRSDDVQMKVRIGLHTGEAIRQEDDFYGRNVILAARIGAAADGGEMLVSSVLKELTEGRAASRSTSPASSSSRACGGTHPAYPVDWASDSVD